MLETIAKVVTYWHATRDQKRHANINENDHPWSANINAAQSKTRTG